jgi:hypothetical protein
MQISFFSLPLEIHSVYDRTAVQVPLSSNLTNYDVMTTYRTCLRNMRFGMIELMITNSNPSRGMAKYLHFLLSSIKYALRLAGSPSKLILNR